MTTKTPEYEEKETKEAFLSVKFDNLSVTDSPAPVRVKHVITLSETKVVARKPSIKFTKKSSKKCLIRKSKLALLVTENPPKDCQVFGDSSSEDLGSFSQISLRDQGNEEEEERENEFKGPAFNSHSVIYLYYINR